MSAPAPRSLQYIEDYPGLTKAALQAVEPGVYLNAQAFLDEMVKQAANTIIEIDMAAALEPYVRKQEELEFGTVGTFSDEAEAATGAEAARGLRVRKDAGMMGKLLIGRAWVAYDTPGDYVLTVTDGVKTETHTVTVVEANVPVAVFTQFETDADKVDLTVAVVTGAKPLGGDISSVAEFAGSGCSDCGPRRRFKMISARGLRGSSEGDGVQGVTADVAITCDLKAAFCIIAPRIKVPIFYATVIKILENWEATSRLNFYAQHKQAWVAKEWEHLANTKYPQAWDLHSKGLANYLEQLDPLCITCGTGTSYGYTRFR